MQAAYWVGRQSSDALGGVAAHLYGEFDGADLELERLRDAIFRLCRLHPTLRLRIDSDGCQHLDPGADPLPLDVEDMRELSADALETRLLAKRRSWSHRRLDLARGEAAAFGLSLLPDGVCRLHVDTDMIAIDPNSFRVVIEDLARLYEHPDRPEAPASHGFFDWLDRAGAGAEGAKRRERDRVWWRARLANVPPAPEMPATPHAPAAPASERLAARLSPDERCALERRARDLRVTPSVLALGLFAAVLGRATGQARFRLNVPSFWRAPLVPDVERIVGEFSNVLILGVDLATPATLADLCRDIGRQMVELIAHDAYPGVSVMRDLSRLHGSVQTAPVVFTAGLGLSGGELFSEVVTRVFGPMNWVISQGPQVAIDAQVAACDGGILVNWDVRLDALPEAWVREAFEAYVALLREVAARSEALGAAPTATSAVPGQEPANPTESMLVSLLGRLSPGKAAHGDSAISEVAQAEIARFLDRYCPSGAPYRPDFDEAVTPRSLARLVRARSGGASDEIARIFLETIDAG
ncbi:MAG: non-ribosomal peptide synthetase [Bosea sp.]|uniref:condensation domain-containing protein n=1 Tax=Bosea sp. (in: a-proteobacteria) TaxID=1871050 RepID=UPI00238987D4|nr:non-ribosomal peptide synthetase [Bosea sp. (in: a-proteobacteria)]MCP4733260.1 non-ribosomal peptide synthetase [Bosea sp. (in: a-proteobacteria)]